MTYDSLQGLCCNIHYVQLRYNVHNIALMKLLLQNNSDDCMYSLLSIRIIMYTICNIVNRLGLLFVIGRNLL